MTTHYFSIPTGGLYGEQLRRETASKLGIEHSELQVMVGARGLEIHLPDEHDHRHDEVEQALNSHIPTLEESEQKLLDAKSELQAVLTELEALPAQQNTVLQTMIRALRALVTLQTNPLHQD